MYQGLVKTQPLPHHHSMLGTGSTEVPFPLPVGGLSPCGEMACRQLYIRGAHKCYHGPTGGTYVCGVNLELSNTLQIALV